MQETVLVCHPSKFGIICYKRTFYVSTAFKIQIQEIIWLECEFLNKNRDIFCSSDTSRPLDISRCVCYLKNGLILNNKSLTTLKSKDWCRSIYLCVLAIRRFRWFGGITVLCVLNVIQKIISTLRIFEKLILANIEFISLLKTLLHQINPSSEKEFRSYFCGSEKNKELPEENLLNHR